MAHQSLYREYRPQTFADVAGQEQVTKPLAESVKSGKIGHAYLFAGIFICIIPVMAMLQAGAKGPFSAVINTLSHEDGTPDIAVYFWATGLLSSFLDNAPTYLVFFQLAGGDPATLMGPHAKTLTAISLGAVFMGANTYIGNAPNFMVYAIARRAGVKMPGFFAYMLWSGVILLPLFAAITWLFL